MKYILFSCVFLACCGCSSAIIATKALKPNHIGITPSCEWEIQHGQNVKHKPKIQSNLDWNF